MASMYDYFKDLPPWGKFLVVAGVGVSGWVIFSKIKKTVERNRDLAGAKQVVNDAGRELQVLTNQGIKPSYADSQYSSWASSIQTAFDGCDPGNNDMAAVMNAINNLKNMADLQKLINAFGIRKWDECGWGTGDKELDLVGGIRNELNTNQIGTINDVLRKKGIAFNF